MIPYFIKSENYSFPEGYYGPEHELFGGFNYGLNLRGKNGLIEVQQVDTSYDNGLTGELVAQAKKVWSNIPTAPNNSLDNGLFPGVGVSPPNLSFSPNAGVRSSAYSAYIQAYTGNNIKSVARVRVNKILFEGTTAIGVVLGAVNTSGFANSSLCSVYAPIVVSAGGVFGTPKLLQLSGVGPRSLLNSLGIPVVVDAPFVGSNYDDEFGLSVPVTQPGLGTAWRTVGSLFWNVDNNPFGGLDFLVNIGTFNQKGGAIVSLTYPQSKGTVAISSTNPDIVPTVTANYLSTSHDRYVLGKALDQMLEYLPLLNFTLAIPDPCSAAGANCSTIDGRLNAYLAAGLYQAGDHWSADRKSVV